MVEDLATEYDRKAVVEKVNVDENPEISAKFRIKKSVSIHILTYFMLIIFVFSYNNITL